MKIGVIHPIAIYAEFESLLTKVDNTSTLKIQKTHLPVLMSYCLYVKASEDVPHELLENFQIPLLPITYRGSENDEEVTKKFVSEVVSVAVKIEKILNTNKPIAMTEENYKAHNEIVKNKTCPLCKSTFHKANIAV